MKPSQIFSCLSHPQLGNNINGPSVIRVPNWVKNAPGRYLMYLAHHQGEYIRLAYADSPVGEWVLYEDGCLHLQQITFIKDHIASPEPVVVASEKEIRLYFHGYRSEAVINPDNISEGQASFCARSKDGVHFTAEEVDLGPYYMRIFTEGNTWFAVAKNKYDGSILLKSADGLSPFVPGPSLLPHSRHVGLQRDSKKRLWIYFSRIGDSPERILKSELIMQGSWRDWFCREIFEVKAPEYDWEGADCPEIPSTKGIVNKRVCQLRDPYVFTDIDGQNYLYYSIAGEKGLAVMQLNE